MAAAAAAARRRVWFISPYGDIGPHVGADGGGLSLPAWHHGPALDGEWAGADVSFEGTLCRYGEDDARWPNGCVFRSKAVADAFLAREMARGEEARAGAGGAGSGDYGPKVTSAVLARDFGASVFVLEIHSDEVFVNGIFATEAEAEARLASARVCLADPRAARARARAHSAAPARPRPPPPAGCVYHAGSRRARPLWRR